MYKRTGWGFAIIALIIGGSLYFITTGNYRLGIDLSGGTELTYELDLSRVADEGPAVAETVKDIVSKRLDAFGLREINIAVTGGNRLVVQLPGASDSQEISFLKQQVEEAGKMVFCLVAAREDMTDSRIKELEDEEARYIAAHRAWIQRKREHDRPFVTEGKEPPKYEEKEKPPEEPEYIVRWEIENIDSDSGRRRETRQKQRRILHNGPAYKVDGGLLARSNATYDENGLPAVAFSFNPQGSAQFAELTGNNKNGYLAIVLDEQVRQVANIKERIAGNGILTGKFTSNEVIGIVTILRGGSLPTKPQLISESSVGAVLGHDSIEGGTKAVLIGLIGILIFMAVYYMVGGMVANLALVFNVILILAFVIVFRQSLTFPGIAGVLLTIAMAIDANILVFERVREELGRGKSLLHSLSNGYRRAFWVIFDSNITTILTAVVLFNFGSGAVKGFAVTLIAGLAASFFTSVFVTRVILSWLYNVGLVKSMKMMKVFSPPRVDYVGNRKTFVGVSVVLIAGTWLGFVLPRGSVNYGIDFTGGARITMNLSKEIEVAQLRKLVDELPSSERTLFRDYSIQTLNANSKGLATRFSLLTRVDETVDVARAAENEPKKEPEKETAKEKPADAPLAAPAGAAAPGPASPVAALPVAAPAATAPPVTPPATATPDSTSGAKGLEVRDRQVTVLKRMLERAQLLLPDPFSEARWEGAGPPGAQRLALDVNLIQVAIDFNEPGKSTAETMASKLNAFLSQHTNPMFRGVGAADPTAFQGIRIEKAEQVMAPGAGDARNQQLSAYRVITQPYVEPSPGADEQTRAAPRHIEVVSEIKDWFRTGSSNQLVISEPIPEVLTVGGKVAADLQASALLAVFISMVGIMFYMALRFELMYGIAGIVALAHDVMMAIGFMALTDALMGQSFSVKINLPEIAAFLTIIGFSINDTIVLFDRVREILKTPMKRKLEYAEIVNAAVNQTLSRTIWTSLTTLVVSLALLLFGGEPIRGFAFAFAIGVVSGVYSTVFIASPIVVALHTRQLKRREMLLAEAAK